MNSSNKPQISSVSGVLGLCAVLCPLPAAAFTPDAESALEILRGNVSAGLASREAYHAFLELLAEDPEADCEVLLAGSDLNRADTRFHDIPEALAEACREAAPAGGPAPGPDPDAPSGVGKKPPRRTAQARKGRASARFSVSQSVRPRSDTGGQSAPSPVVRGEGALPGIAWRLDLKEYRPYHRHVRLGSERLFLHAGHLHSALDRTRLDFVAGSRFYAGWRGGSGVGDLLSSPLPALDGLGAGAHAGAWIAEAAGAWNRLEPAGRTSDDERRDALLYVAGFAWETRLALRIQTAHQRFESSRGDPSSATILGGALSGSPESGLRWRIGMAGSLTQAPDRRHGTGPGAGLGAYGEAFLESSGTGAERWRLEARQATEGWANPLQSPRGHLRDTLDGRWILPGRGEGDASGRVRFPVLEKTGFRASLRGSLGSDWALSRGLLAGEGSAGLALEAGPWTHETGSFLAYRAPGLPEAGGALGWGQSLAWRRAPWKAKASLSGTGGGRSGSRPALAIDLEHRRREGRAWGAEFAIRDLGYPARYLRIGVRQEWPVGAGMKVSQSLRMPWTPDGPGSDMGYQLRLEAALRGDMPAWRGRTSSSR